MSISCCRAFSGYLRFERFTILIDWMREFVSKEKQNYIHHRWVDARCTLLDRVSMMVAICLCIASLDSYGCKIPYNTHWAEGIFHSIPESVQSHAMFHTFQVLGNCILKILNHKKINFTVMFHVSMIFSCF